MNDNDKELFFTRRQHTDEELTNLIKILNMKPVRIQKGKINRNKATRFKIVPYKRYNNINYKIGSFTERDFTNLENPIFEPATPAQTHRLQNAGSVIKKRNIKNHLKSRKLQNKNRKTRKHK
jgi:putative cell wall-binding protein